MTRFLSLVAVVVPDYDEAIEFYVNRLGFRLVEDSVQTPEKRWVVVAPSGAAETHLLLAKAANPQQVQSIGNQTGGRVFLFLKSDQFDADYAAFRAAGIKFLEAPRQEPYGRVVVFQDPFGNKWDLLENVAP